MQRVGGNRCAQPVAHSPDTCLDPLFPLSSPEVVRVGEEKWIYRDIYRNDV